MGDTVGGGLHPIANVLSGALTRQHQVNDPLMLGRRFYGGVLTFFL
jgi:hypothetical protein